MDNDSQIDENVTSKVKIVKSNDQIRFFIYGELLEPFSHEIVFALEDCKKEKIKTIVFEIHSDGGDVDDTVTIISKMEEMQGLGFTFIADVRGTALSAAAILCLYCNKIIMYRAGYIMFHQFSTSFYDEKSTSIMEINKFYMALYQDLIDEGFRRRKKKMKEKLIMTENKDFYFSAAEAKKLGIIDEVL